MVVFPLFKLVAVGIRQISKPMALKLTEEAKTNPFIRKYVCIPSGHAFHYFENQLKFIAMNLIKPKNVPIPKLSEDRAIEIGTQVVAELVAFVIAGTVVIWEVLRQRKNEKIKAAKIQAEKDNIRNQFDEFHLRLTEQEEELSSIIQSFKLLKDEIITQQYKE